MLQLLSVVMLAYDGGEGAEPRPIGTDLATTVAGTLNTVVEAGPLKETEQYKALDVADRWVASRVAAPLIHGYVRRGNVSDEHPVGVLQQCHVAPVVPFHGRAEGGRRPRESGGVDAVGLSWAGHLADHHMRHQGPQCYHGPRHTGEQPDAHQQAVLSEAQAAC